MDFQAYKSSVTGMSYCDFWRANGPESDEICKSHVTHNAVASGQPFAG